MSWKASLTTENATWRAVVEYADERIAELTATCTAVESTDIQIRQAQAGVLEMQRLKSIPSMLVAESQIRASMGARKEY